ncbi:hypothetical protein BHM03_00003519 [Ensete ventricosum]|nr:hypothetical protein BHM03_00003519 [Ensete ventricosum]
MRLNRVELFYVLVAAIGSESRHCLRGRGGHMQAICMQRWLATLGPLQGRPTMAWLPTRGGRPQGAATHSHGRLRPARKGLSPAASPAASRGGGDGRKGGRPLGRVAVDRKGQPPPAQGQRRRRPSEGEGGLRHLFKKDGYAP